MKTKFKVLIVDDELEFLELMGQAFERQGCETQMANNAKGAFTFIEAIKFDAIISDINMPGLSGVELMKTIRTQAEAPVVFLMSGHEFNAKQFTDLGAAGFFSKPFSRALMMKKVISTLIARQESRDSEAS